jgi:hypothetical protein
VVIDRLVQLVFVEPALQAQERPIIAVSRRIDRLLIDQPGVDHAAHLDQLFASPMRFGSKKPAPASTQTLIALEHSIGEILLMRSV